MNLNLTRRAFHESLPWAFSPGSESVVPAGVSQPEYLRVDTGSKGRAHEWGVPTGVPGVGHSGESSTHEPQESLPFLIPLPSKSPDPNQLVRHLLSHIAQ